MLDVEEKLEWLREIQLKRIARANENGNPSVLKRELKVLRNIEASILKVERYTAGSAARH